MVILDSLEAIKWKCMLLLSRASQASMEEEQKKLKISR